MVNMKFPGTAGLKKYSGFLTGALVSVFFVALLALYAGGDSLPPLQSNNAYAADGDSLSINGVRIRLLGIDAPERDQNCQSVDGANWPCGRMAKDRLAELVDGVEVSCTGTARDQYDRLLARCAVGGRDLGQIMVLEGFAVSYNDYKREESIARTGNKGMWSGLFTQPRDWRDGERLDNSQGSWWSELFR